MSVQIFVLIRSSCAASGIIASSLESGSFNLVVYQIENYFPNIKLFYFLQFMPVVEMVRMFEDLLISYLCRQKLSSQDGYQMRKIH